MIAVTEGMDNASQTFRNDPVGIGRWLACGFNARPASFPFLIGVGTGKPRSGRPRGFQEGHSTIGIGTEMELRAILQAT
jgi:hypothetical protein